MPSTPINLSAHTSTPAAATAAAYLRTKVMTARPEELRLMLLDGAIKFARQGRDGLERRDYEAMFNGFSQCRDIVSELIVSVRPEPDAELADRVRSLYSFIYATLVNASLEKSVSQADEAIKLIEYERETWLMLMQKVSEERVTGVVPGSGVAPSTSPDRIPIAVSA
jgi:flagellar secretion chaperone FliS